MSTSKLFINKSSLDYPVALSKYYYFSNENYYIFTLVNNLNQTLNSITFQISEFDQNNNLIERVTINAQKLNIVNNKEFTLPNRLSVKQNCHYIEYKLLQADFADAFYNEGKLQRKEMNFHKEVVGEVAKEYKVSNDQIVESNAKKSGSSFRVTSFKQKKKIRLVPFICCVLGIIALVFFTIFINSYKNDLKIIYDGSGYKLTFIEGSEGLTITEFSGHTTNLTIKEEYYGKKVIAIADEAMSNSDIKNLTIFVSDLVIGREAFKEAELESVSGAISSIGDSAFLGCSNLVEVNLEVNGQIGYDAFAEDYNLKVVNLGDNSLVNSRIFTDSEAIETFGYGNSNLAYLFQMFGESQNDIPNNLTYLRCNMSYISSYFLTGCSSVPRANFEFPTDATIEAGALTHLG